MKTDHISNFTRGWFIGNFEPSILQTEDFEVAIITHKQDEEIPKHFHPVATEYNVMLSGRMWVNGRNLTKGDMFSFEPDEICNVQVLEDSEVLCVKVPSIQGDKVCTRQ